ncbi:MAG: 50S ribosomal protein L10 [Bacteroidota bacterium]
MKREEKGQVVAEFREKLANASGAVLADFRGLTVKESTELRRRLREQGVELRVVKNRLLQRAAQQAGVSGLDPYLEGPTAIALSQGDPAAMAKVLHQFTREHKNLVLKAGVLSQRAITSEEVVKLAELPPREVLLGRVLGQMQAPLVGLVSVLQGSVRQLVYALDAIRRQREEAGGAATPAS